LKGFFHELVNWDFVFLFLFLVYLVLSNFPSSRRTRLGVFNALLIFERCFWIPSCPIVNLAFTMPEVGGAGINRSEMISQSL